jgi:cysteinyl-tRNA synthetase
VLGLGLASWQPKVVAAPPEVEALAAARAAARRTRDFAEADRLRAELALRGWDMEDRADGYALKPRPVASERQR